MPRVLLVALLLGEPVNTCRELDDVGSVTPANDGWFNPTVGRTTPAESLKPSCGTGRGHLTSSRQDRRECC